MQEASTLLKVVRLQLQFYSLVEIKATLTLFKSFLSAYTEI